MTKVTNSKDNQLSWGKIISGVLILGGLVLAIVVLLRML